MCPWDTGRAMNLEGVKISFEEQECTYLLVAFIITQEEKYIGKQILKKQEINAQVPPGAHIPSWYNGVAVNTDESS